MRVPTVRILRAALLPALAMATLGVSACAPPPTAEPADLFAGGSYPVDVVVAPQTVSTEFSLFGLATCTSTVVTPSVDVHGSLTVAPAQLDPSGARITIPGASLELPASTVSAGSLTLACDGELVGAVGVSLRFDGTASVQSVVLDPGADTLSLTDPTITLTDVRATFAGAPAGTPPTPLAPITVTVPSIDVDV